MSTTWIDRVAVEVEGDGAPVILVHGLGGSSNTFQPQVAALRGFRIIRPDLPGAARSPLPPEAPTMASFADAILRVARELGVTRAHLVGHSMGTVVCQLVAARQPDLVASLVLFGPIMAPSDAMRSGLGGRATLARGEGMAPIADQIVGGGLSPETKASRPVAVAFVRESILRQDPEGYACHCEALAAAEAADHARIAAPTLLLTGDADGTAPPANAHALGERIKGSTVSIIEQSGHWATIERPDACSEHLARFLSQVA